MTTALQIPKLDSSNIQKVGTTILLKGDPGTHKTFNVLSWPGKTVLVYFDANTSTTKEDVFSGRVELWQPETLHQLETELLPMIRHRELDVANVGIDTLSNLSKFVFRELEGPKGANKHTWGRLKQVLDNVCWSFTASTFYKEGLPSYNCLVTSHLKDIMTGEPPNMRLLKANQVNVDGGFVNAAEGFFDNVFLTRSVPVTETVNGVIKTIGERFYCCTVPPTNKDTTKSEIRNGNRLPPEIDATYENLMKAWGEVRNQNHSIGAWADDGLKPKENGR
jgi:hypothetical protein